MAFAAGLVRGFSGFALSALLMSALIAILPPVEILPIALILELAASVAMVRDGIRSADRRIATGLIVGSAIGVPIGLTALKWMEPGTSSGVALTIILAMAVLLSMNVRPRTLDSTPGLYGSGLASGFVSGIAGVGGLVVAVYALALGRSATIIRGTLVIYLFVSILVSLVTFVIFGIFTSLSLARAAVLVGPMIGGLLIGSRLFSKSMESLYRRICLGLLIAISLAGLLRLAI